MTRWFLRAGIVSLLAALLLLLAEGVGLGREFPYVARSAPVSLHLLVMGWLTQLIFGVSFWMFPRHPTRPPRGPESLAWAAFVLLNAGLLLRVAAEPSAPGTIANPALLVSAILQAMAVLSWSVLIWPRIRPR